MMETRIDKHRNEFERTYGEGKWTEFCELVWQVPRTRPGDVQAQYGMSKPTYYKWEARAMEVKP